MAKEIERKFRVKNSEWMKIAGPGKLIKQAYLCIDPERTIRIRIFENNAFLTLKGINEGISRDEYEYSIPLADAEQIAANLCIGTPIIKRRYIANFQEKKWEIDVFEGRNSGLVIAEIELMDENEYFEIPEWLSEEVSLDFKYQNSNLTIHPFSEWNELAE
jgi:adenylate cyclase